MWERRDETEGSWGAEDEAEDEAEDGREGAEYRYESEDEQYDRKVRVPYLKSTS